MATTPAATRRADTSLTGLGNEKSSRTAMVENLLRVLGPDVGCGRGLLPSGPVEASRSPRRGKADCRGLVDPRVVLASTPPAGCARVRQASYAPPRERPDRPPVGR